MPTGLRYSNPDRFLATVEPCPASGCWFWLGPVSNSGYGRAKTHGAGQGAHRVAYFLFVGPIPVGFHVCHRCDIKLCVAPHHLFLATQRENVADCQAKGRARLGDRSGPHNGRAKLTLNDVRAIRASLATGSSLAAEYRVSISLIGQIRRRQAWKTVG